MNEKMHIKETIAQLETLLGHSNSFMARGVTGNTLAQYKYIVSETPMIINQLNDYQNGKYKQLLSEYYGLFGLSHKQYLAMVIADIHASAQKYIDQDGGVTRQGNIDFHSKLNILMTDLLRYV